MDHLHQFIHGCIFGNLLDWLSLAEKEKFICSSRNTDICLSGFSRSVYGTAHYGYSHFIRKVFDFFFDLFGYLDQGHLCSSACRTGDQSHSLFTKSQRTEYGNTGFYFFFVVRIFSLVVLARLRTQRKPM